MERALDGLAARPSLRGAVERHPGHRLQGKLLLTVGELDHNVDPSSTMQVVNALIAADKDFELIVFPGRDHGAGSSPYGRRRMRDFFVKNLLGVEPRSK